MHTTYLMVITYILYCIRIGTKPCKYFQLNSPFFDRQQGIFSKLSIDRMIPEKWRLHQQLDSPDYEPEAYPVFLKPEWGQNASGIQRADSLQELNDFRKLNENSNVRYLIQQGAEEENEYEIFSLVHHKDSEKYSIFTITQAVNASERFPINSIYNKETEYVEITENVSEQQRNQIWKLVKELGEFRISRVSARADSLEDLCQGRFHIIEVNLFLPMPINLMDARLSKRDIFFTVLAYMKCLALATKYRDKTLTNLPIFTKIMMYNRENPLINFIRARI